MKKSALFAFTAAAAVGFVFSSCNCPGGGNNDGGEDGGPCIDAGEMCTPGAGLGCCGSGICNASTNVCEASCKDPGVACTSGSECCFNSCVNQKCAASCKPIGDSCGGGSECCTGNCGAGNVCADIPGRPAGPDGGAVCEVRGTLCTENAQCCSTYCKRGACAPAYTCGAYNDVCGFGSECCSGQCSVDDGGFGYCLTVQGGGAPNCAPTGNPCNAGTDCCTTVCSNLGTVPVCQPVSGCQVAGDYCVDNLQCCGGAPNGPVNCRPATDRCDQGTSCRMPGNICGKPTESDGGLARLPDGGVFSISSETNCCNGMNGPSGSDLTCHVDPAGVPRCYGVTGGTTCPTGYTGEPGCCIATGDYCDFKGQCCGGGSCVVGADGGRQCETATCLGLGSTCTAGASSGCCPGTTCLPTSEISYACQVQQPTGDGGTTPDGGGGCKPNGTNCGSSAECCSQPQGGFCNVTCQPPQQCQPQGSTCTVAGDCCTGLDCVSPDGGQKSCQPGATCPNAGQACTPRNLCCNEGTALQCLDTAGQPCAGNSACTCNFIFAKGDYSSQP